MGYAAVHQTMKRHKGPAKEWGCAFCAVPAHQWAYNHDPLYEMVSELGHPYSNDPQDYIPLCHACHRELDCPGSYRSHKVLTVEPHQRVWGAYQRDMTPHLFQE